MVTAVSALMRGDTGMHTRLAAFTAAIGVAFTMIITSVGTADAGSRERRIAAGVAIGILGAVAISRARSDRRRYYRHRGFRSRGFRSRRFRHHRHSRRTYRHCHSGYCHRHRVRRHSHARRFVRPRVRFHRSRGRFHRRGRIYRRY